MVRLFVALGLPESIRLRLASLAGGIDGARWVPPENLHITLRFIGEASEDRIADVADALGAIRMPPLTVTLRGAGHFSSGKKTRAVWIGVEKTGELATLQARIERAVIGGGFDPERRKFMPHVTIGRLRQARADHVRSWLEANGAFEEAPFGAERFILYESRLGRSGPIYLTLAEFALAPVPR